MLQTASIVKAAALVLSKARTCRNSRSATSCCLQVKAGFGGILFRLSVISLDIILCSDLATRLTGDSIPWSYHLNLRSTNGFGFSADLRPADRCRMSACTHLLLIGKLIENRDDAQHRLVSREPRGQHRADAKGQNPGLPEKQNVWTDLTCESTCFYTYKPIATPGKSV